MKNEDAKRLESEKNENVKTWATISNRITDKRII